MKNTSSKKTIKVLSLLSAVLVTFILFSYYLVEGHGIFISLASSLLVALLAYGFVLICLQQLLGQNGKEFKAPGSFTSNKNNRISSVVQKEGRRNVIRRTKFYNLDAIKKSAKAYNKKSPAGQAGRAGDRQPIFSFAFNASCSTPEKFTCASSAASFSHAGMLSVFLTGFCCFL